MLLRSLHNLPRPYLRNDIDTLCDLKQCSIREQDAIAYSVSNMDNRTKEKYYDIYNPRPGDNR